MTQLDRVLAIAADDARMARPERYADQRAHDVANMTAAGREEYGARMAALDSEVAAWNAALASGDAARIAAARTATLAAVHERIMADDDYQGRTHGRRCAR